MRHDAPPRTDHQLQGLVRERRLLVHVDGDADLLFEVDDWVDGVRVMDPRGEDVSVGQAVDYFAARAVGHTREEAQRLALNR